MFKKTFTSITKPLTKMMIQLEDFINEQEDKVAMTKTQINNLKTIITNTEYETERANRLLRNLEKVFDL